MNNAHPTNGMSAVELMVGIGVFSLLLLVLIAAYFAYTNVFSIQGSRNEVQTESIRIQRLIDSEVRRATKVLSSRTISGTAYQTDGDTVVLEAPAIRGDGSVVPNAFDTIVFERNAGTQTLLDEIVDAVAASSRKTGTRRLTSIVSDLSFQYNSPDISSVDEVTTVLILAKRGGTRTFDLTTETNARLRNK